MFQLIQQDNVFQDREQRLGKDVSYCKWISGLFDDEEAMMEEEKTQGPGTDQYDRSHQTYS